MAKKPTGLSEDQTPYETEAKSSTRVKLTAVGNSVGLVLPKEVLARMKLEKGDQLSIVETPEGILLKPHDPEFEKKMAVARDIMKRYRNALRELAK